MRTYEPTNTLKTVAKDVWIVDGPIIKMKLLGLGVPFPTRMTIVRLGAGELFVHSPIALTQDLETRVKALGTPRYLIAPSWLHYWWLPDWKRAFPDALVFLAEGVRKRAKTHIDLEAKQLDRDQKYPWEEIIHTLPVKGLFGTEVIFFHRKSRTLILTDFIENFEPRLIDSFFLRCLIRIGGVQDPDGGMPRDMRLSYSGRVLRGVVETMLAWKPERIVIAHGRWYESHAETELRRAFRWLLERK
ncbi:MAG TPA: DUF4336 domain-containing protein [Steroidobacteraceae bacterium]